MNGFFVKVGHITLADVAKHANVSVSTASRALAGLKVSKDNLARVKQSADELGYVMNEAARALRNVRSMTIGLVFHELTGQFGIELLSAVSSRFDTHGYCVFVATAQGDKDRFDKLVHRFLERRVDALLCVHGAGKGEALERYRSAGIPVVGLITKKEGYSSLPLLAPSAKIAAHECVNRLRELGHRQLLALRPLAPWAPLEMFIKAAKEGGMTVNVEAIPDRSFDPVRALEFCRGEKNNPTVIAATQVEAANLVVTAQSMGIKIPDDLSIVAVRDRSTIVPATTLPMSMIYMDPQKIGLLVADKLCEQLNGGDAITGDHFVEEGSWLERATTGPAKKS